MPRRTLYLLPTYKVGCSKLKYQAGGDCAEKALSTALCGLKAQQVPSPGQRPGCHCPHSLRPVRAKVKANRSPILLPLQGVGVYTLIPRALPWAGDLLGFQPAQGRRQSFFRTISPPLLNISNLNPQPPAAMPHSHQIKKLPPSATI